jgi:hypothetical protein
VNEALAALEREFAALYSPPPPFFPPRKGSLRLAGDQLGFSRSTHATFRHAPFGYRDC